MNHTQHKPKDFEKSTEKQVKKLGSLLLLHCSLVAQKSLKIM
jgi:hypothetical protein